MRAWSVVSVLVFAAACGTPPPPADDGGSDGGRRSDAGQDTGPPVPSSTAHCTYDPIPATAHSGGTVQDAPFYAGVGESVLHVPIGVTLGAYAGRAEGAGSDGFIDDRRTEIAGAFAASVGIETWPRARALVISSGCTGTPSATDACGDTILLLKADLAIGFQGLVHEVERRLGPDFAGRVVIATSHSHSSFANYTAHSGMQVAFGPFRRTVFDAIASDLEAVARHALSTRAPARVGFSHDGNFDLDDHVNRDRRDENDALAGGRRDDHDLFVLRVDTYDPSAPTDPSTPLALVPVFGMHGTIHDADNVLTSTDAPGGVERVVEEHFDRPVLVMHLQGAGGDVSPVGLEGGTQCPTGTRLCHDYMRAESVGWNALDAILAAYDAAGASMLEHAPIEMVTRSIERGPDWTRFTVRNGALSYTAWDGYTPADRNVVDATGAIISPIDEFNAPNGAALCGGADGTFVPTAQIPGTRGLTQWPYASCNRIEAVQRLLSGVLSLDLGDHAPICDTTRTTISALRIGDWYMSVLPGEPITLSVDRMRELVTTVPADHHIVVGYAQDNNGYIMVAEDWILGGYEPTITFWGPLDGEMILEQTAQLFPMLATPERENAAMGETHVATPSPAEDLHRDATPTAGTVPASVPAYLATRLLPAFPTSVQPPATLHRFESAFFTWIGADPLDGTPEVSIEMRQPDGSFLPLTRHSGRVVGDGDFLLSWTPNPLNHDATFAPRTHYWTVEWQAVPALGQVGFEDLATRAGLPLGTYRIVVIGPSYSLHSSEFQVVAGAIELARTGGTGTHVELSAGYHAPGGYRMLDPQTGATQLAPIRGGTVDIGITTSSGTTTMTGVAIDMNGHVAFDTPAGATAVSVTDVYGNTGTLTL